MSVCEHECTMWCSCVAMFDKCVYATKNWKQWIPQTIQTKERPTGKSYFPIPTRSIEIVHRLSTPARFSSDRCFSFFTGLVNSLSASHARRRDKNNLKLRQVGTHKQAQQLSSLLNVMADKWGSRARLCADAEQLCSETSLTTPSP